MPPKREWEECMSGLRDVERKINVSEPEQAIAHVKDAMEYMVRMQKRVRTFVECVDKYSSLMEGARNSETETPEMKGMVDSMLEVKRTVGINGPLDEFEEAVRRENDESESDEDDDDDDEDEEEKKEDSDDDDDDESDDESDEDDDVEEVEDEEDEEDEDEEEVVVIEIKDDEGEVVIG
jgi:hypothetical protein